MTIASLEKAQVARLRSSELLAACYRVAGHLVMMEKSGTGGWGLVWENPGYVAGEVAYPATASACVATMDWHAVITMGGLAAELFQQGLWLNGDELYEKACEFGMWKGTCRLIVNAAPAMAPFTIDTVSECWPDIESYAQRAAEQWSDPLALSDFRIDRIFPNSEGLPGHFQPACRAGQRTRAALVQSVDTTYHIPSDFRA